MCNLFLKNTQTKKFFYMTTHAARFYKLKQLPQPALVCLYNTKYQFINRTVLWGNKFFLFKTQ